MPKPRRTHAFRTGATLIAAAFLLSISFVAAAVGPAVTLS